MRRQTSHQLRCVSKGLVLIAVAWAGLVLAGTAWTQEKKPNVLVIWGDDIGTWNISHNNRGMMGYRTPNIDRIAKEGLSFTDYYGQQSCTAGRAAFINGSVPVRTGMTKAGIPVAEEAHGDGGRGNPRRGQGLHPPPVDSYAGGG